MKNAFKNLKTKFSLVSSNKNVTVVEEPLDCDILLGKDKTAFNHKGNRSFRDFILLHLQQYDVDAKSRMEKTSVVNAVFEAITEAGGRFLMQDSKTKKWVTVGPEGAKKKIGHAFRDAVSKRKKLAATGREEGITGHEVTFARRTSELAIAKARRRSLTESRRVPPLDPNCLARISRSCNDLVTVDEPAIGNSMALNAQRVCLELGETSDDDDDNKEKSQRERSQLLIDPRNHPDLQDIPDPTPLRNTVPISTGVKKRTFLLAGKRTTQKQLPKETNNKSFVGVDKKIFDDPSGELSVMSEDTNKKWFDLGSTDFSIDVDTNIFDDHDGDETNQAGLPPELIEKVNRGVTNLEVSGMRISSYKDKGRYSLARVNRTAIGNSFAFNTQRVCLKLDENNDVNNELTYRERSQLLFDPGNHPVLQNIPDPTPIRSTVPISAGVKKRTFLSAGKRTTQKQLPKETNNKSFVGVDKKIFDDPSGELSVMSEDTNKKWFDLGSADFSIDVDTNIFDDHDGDETKQAGVPRDQAEKVKRDVTNLTVLSEHSSSSQDKGGCSFSLRKNVNEMELSEEFRMMGLDTRTKFERIV